MHLVPQGGKIGITGTISAIVSGAKMQSNNAYKTNLLIIQSTPFCNINCSYCYLSTRNQKGVFPIEFVDTMVENLIASDLLTDQLSICWHSGEPLILKPTYYREFIQAFKKKCPSNIHTSFQVQTNGTLISQEYCDLIKEYNIQIGVSIDGPQFINDLHRKNRKNGSTFSETMRGIELLKKNGIPFSVIAVLSNYSLEAFEEIFAFFTTLGAYHIGFNCEEVENANLTSSLNNQYDKYYRFFNKLNSQLKSANPNTLPAFREIEVMEQHIDHVDDYFVNSQIEPFNIVSVDHKGNYSTFSPELLGAISLKYSDFILGNINSGRIIDSINSPVFTQLYADINTGVENCRSSCDYFQVCGGGAPSNKFFENHSFDSTETSYCKLTVQAIANVIVDNMYEHL